MVDTGIIFLMKIYKFQKCKSRTHQLNNKKMAKKISKFQKTFIMRNPLVQIFKFIWLNYKILSVVAMGHGGTREKTNN